MQGNLLYSIPNIFKHFLKLQNFQNLEEDHIKQMKEYLASYYQILDSGHALIGQVYKEFQNNCHEMSTERLLELFTKSKGTGTTKLGMLTTLCLHGLLIFILLGSMQLTFNLKKQM